MSDKKVIAGLQLPGMARFAVLIHEKKNLSKCKPLQSYGFFMAVVPEVSW